MYKIRQIKYSEVSVSIQVYKIENRKRVIVRHIGTARNQEEKTDLLSLANDFIEKASRQLHLFETNQMPNNIMYLNQTEFIGVHFTFLYELLSKLITKIGFDKIKNQLLLDLIILRMIEPASKIKSIDLLEEYFGIRHRRQNYYRYAQQWLSLKSKIESISLKFAQACYDFNFDIL